MDPHTEYPPLPRVIDAPGGPVDIVVGERLPGMEDGRIGEFDGAQRRIWVFQGLSVCVQWATLYHEIVHVALNDAGLSNMLSTKKQEAICDALATARMRERFGYRQDQELP